MSRCEVPRHAMKHLSFFVSLIGPADTLISVMLNEVRDTATF